MGCTGALLAPARQYQTLVLKGRRDARCHWSDPAVSADLWEYYLPYLYSCISLFGVLLLLCELWDISQSCPSPGGPSCAGCGSPGVPGWERELLPANGAGVRRGCDAGLSTHPLTRTLGGGMGRARIPGHPLLSLSSHRSVHPLRPLHHVHRHREAAGETSGKVSSSPGPTAPAWGLAVPGAAWSAIPGTGCHSRLLTGSSPIPSS